MDKVTKDDELDADSPADVRITFSVLMGVAALLCAIPRQWASAAILLGLAVSVGALHYVAQRRQVSGLRPPPPAPSVVPGEGEQGFTKGAPP